MKKIAVVAGTRPEAIKMAPVFFELSRESGWETVFLATAQHRQMLDQTLAVFGIQPTFDLDLMREGQTLEDLTARVLQSVSAWCQAHRPDAILVQGDTTTVLATALAAFYQNIPIGHVEAGLRTGDLRSPFPEEMNRRLTSPLVRWHFCPTQASRDNLLREAIPESSIHITGNTVVDALLWVRQRVAGLASGTVAQRLKIPDAWTRLFLDRADARWILVTGHRRESFGEGFENICRGLLAIAQQHADVGILYPVHLNPRVREPVDRWLRHHSSPDLAERIALVEPAAYEDFVWLMDRATFLLSDSGGVQEEAPSLGKPVLVMRETTERPEGVEAGTSRLVGTDPAVMLREASQLLEDRDEYARRCRLANPFGDGQSAARIRAILADAWQ